ncbi:HlyD family efflux transporter periplasmic adaptor subunit [Clostridium sp. 19966]|uniref:efflux RND transporter periplasmic adaptor subunit n=1 Tax=Clostridium sp. 19966 TaxID=2768166 RepID=UPI0028DE6110|nr:HlyD family efflux transporter periplasmic adaptor subunit [Clostridium sp. 19966]MDT8717554.1 HlyD family efflux transporter periplasmic adaptor subunit [Clostridium sp. 19966]
MNIVIRNLDEITDSRELLEARPHRFTSTFAYILIAIFISALLWAYFGKIDIVVSTNGVVKSDEKASSVINEVDGKVNNIRFKDGQKVKKGDVLYTLECKDFIAEKNNYEEQLKALQLEISEIDKLINSVAENKSYFDSNIQDKKEYLQYTTTIENLLSIRKQYEEKQDELEKDIANLQTNIDESTVKASIDGIVSVKNDISIDQVIKNGQEILIIIPQNSSQYKVQLYVSDKDIAAMKPGKTIKYHFQALPYKEYGELKGKITDVSVESSVDEKSGTSYYLAEATIENKPLVSYKGEKGELKLGMACEAQVITERKKILSYLLEKVNLIN